jgi:hypothetical protein
MLVVQMEYRGTVIPIRIGVSQEMGAIGTRISGGHEHRETHPSLKMVFLTPTKTG